MPSKKQNYSSNGLIVDEFGDAGGVGNNRYVSEIFDKYSPCNPKYIKISQSKGYIKHKLEKAIGEVKRGEKNASDATSHKMMMDIWNALCPIKNNSPHDVPDMLYEDVESIIRAKTKEYLKKYKNVKKPKFAGKFSDSEEDASDDDENSASDSEEEVVVKKSTKKPVKKAAKKTAKKVTKKPVKKVETTSEEDSEESSDSDDE